MAREEDLAAAVRAAFSDEAVELLALVERALHALLGARPAEREGLYLEMLRPLHTLKGAASAAGERGVNEECHLLEEAVREAQRTGAPLEGTALDLVLQRIDRIHKQITAEPRTQPVRVTAPVEQELPSIRTADDVLRIPAARIDSVQALAGELALIRLQQETLGARLAAARDALIAAQDRWRALGPHLEGASRGARGAALRASRDALGSALGAGIHQLSALTRDVPLHLAQAAAVGASLDDALRELRLMPLEPFLREFGRTLLMAAQETGRRARREVEAGGTEMDRAVLVRLREPILHLVRNAVVHGLELEAVRVAAGKPAVGTVTLSARCEGPRAILEVRDDGAGLDEPEIRRQALAQGLLDADAPLSPEGVLAVLTRPGFSTYAEVDRMAGRGIGLDVVAGVIHELGGTLSLGWEPGRGTRFVLDVPIAASVQRCLVVSVNGSAFAVPLPHIERVQRVGAGDVLEVEGRPTVRVGADPAALVPLAALLEMPTAEDPPARRPAVVLRQGRQRLVLLVDDIPGEQAMVIKPLGPAFESAGFLLGGTVQSDGAVLPILNVAALFQLAAGAQPREGMIGLPVEQRRAGCRVLVADDSITMRTLLRNVLQASGYQVVVAQDGEAALQQFNELDACDLVITDLQMPRMDGVALSRAIRGSARPHTPIIMVTSVGAQEERRRALEAGADAYIVKGDFEQARFLDLVAELTGDGAGTHAGAAR